MAKGAPKLATRALNPLGVAHATRETATMVATNRGVSLENVTQEGEVLDEVLKVPPTVAKLDPDVLRQRVIKWPKWKAQ